MITGIYKLEFSGTDKVYIGQSKNIQKRFSSHKFCFKNNIAPTKLQSAYTAYGAPTLCILYKDFDKDYCLDEIEERTIIEYDSVNSGFNTLRKSHGGSLSGQDHHQANHQNKTYIEIFKLLVDRPELYHKEIAGIAGTSIPTVSLIASGASHRWLQEEYPEEYAILLSRKGTEGDKNPYSKYSNALYISAFMEIVNHPEKSQKDIAKELSISENVVANISSGAAHKWLEDLYPEEYIKLVNLRNNRTHGKSASERGVKYPPIISPEGKIYYNIPHLTNFAKEHDLGVSHLCSVLNGKRNTHKGWKVYHDNH